MLFSARDEGKLCGGRGQSHEYPLAPCSLEDKMILYVGTEPDRFEDANKSNFEFKCLGSSSQLELYL